jgi:predicted nucleic acid-binding protein
MAGEGLIDTSIFIHAQTHDQYSGECRRFLESLERGEIQARLEPIVLHELSYALPHYRKQMTREDVAVYLLTVLGFAGIVGDKSILVDATERWRDTPGLAFVDSYLAALGVDQSCPVYTKNVNELRGQGVMVPAPLPP